MLDTNVLVAALRSDQGASFRLLSLVGATDRFDICLSVPLVLEYEDVLGREGIVPNASADDIQDLIDYLCSVATPRGVFFLWRPVLRRHSRNQTHRRLLTSACRPLAATVGQGPPYAAR